MSAIKKFKKGFYEFTNLFKIMNPLESIPDPEVKMVIPYRGTEEIIGDVIKADDINAIQQNGTIFSNTTINNSLGQGVEGYELVDYINEQDVFNGLKLKLLISKTNMYKDPKLTKDSVVYSTVKAVNEELVPIEVGDLVKNKVYDFIYVNGKFILQNENRAGETIYGVITEARIKELAASEVLKVTNIYVPIPVGGIYVSTNNVNPATVWKNTTWEEFGQGKVLIGQDTTNTNFNTLGKTGGVYDVTLNVNQMPNHNHATDAQGNHSHYVNPNGNHNHLVDNHAHYVPPHQHVASFGDYRFGNNKGDFGMAYPWGIFDASGFGSRPSLANWDWEANNIWGYTSPTDVWTNGSQPGTNVAGWHDHSTNAVGNHQHNITATGGNQAHTNIQPYITVKIWKRLT